jgi:hypothetical protein
MSCGKFVFPSYPSHYLPLPILDVLILALASESQALLGFSPLPSSILISLHLHSVSFFSALLSLNSSLLSSFLSKNCFNTGYWCQNQTKYDLEALSEGGAKGNRQRQRREKSPATHHRNFGAATPNAICKQRVAKDSRTRCAATMQSNTDGIIPMRFASNKLQKTIELLRPQEKKTFSLAQNLLQNPDHGTKP